MKKDAVAVFGAGGSALSLALIASRRGFDVSLCSARGGSSAELSTMTAASARPSSSAATWAMAGLEISAVCIYVPASRDAK